MIHFDPTEFRCPVKIFTQSEEIRVNADGIPERETKIISTRAKIQSFKGNEYEQLEADRGVRYKNITIRWRPGIDERAIIQYMNDQYEIVSLQDVDERHRYLQIKMVKKYVD